MEIIIGKNSGFCRGVSYTIDKAMENLKDNDKVYSLGEIVHNEEVVSELENMGLVTVSDIDTIPDNSKVIIRAHGESLEVYEKAKKKNLDIIDLTCGKIKLIHKQVMENDDKFIIIIAKLNHPETIGTKGHATCSYIVSSPDDLDDCYKVYKNSHKKDIYIISQTTFNSHKFDELVDLIKSKFDTNIIINKSICDATEKRQKEVIELSKKVDLMIIIGGKNSSNTKELYNLSKIYCENTYLIQNYKDISFNINKDMKIGIMAGASTRKKTVDRVIEELKNMI